MHKLFAYPGGKWPIRNLVVSCFPKHTTYVDVFGGSAAILITKEPSDGEVFNDKNEHIVNFFRVVKHRPAELAERARHWIHSRLLWIETKDVPPPVDEMEKAFRFWVLLADSFGARGMHFGTSKEGIHSVTRARQYLNDVAERLASVHVESMDFLKVITVYDSKDTFFYCDPPYRGTKGGGSNYDLLSDEEWMVMRDALRKIKGKFLLSHNDDAFVLDLFRKFHLREIDVRVTLSRVKGNVPRREVLISNYELPEGAQVALRKRKRLSKYAAPAPRSTHSPLERGTEGVCNTRRNGRAQ